MSRFASGTVPSAPWKLRGEALLWLFWQDAQRARRQVPRQLRIIRMLPRRTPAALYVARYAADSTLQYSEMIIARAVTWRRGHIGVWLPELWVDEQRSLLGGHRIWGLPKQMANFHWSDQALRVTTEDRVLCELQWAAKPPARWRLPLMAPVASLIEGRLHSTAITGSARVDHRATRVLHCDLPDLSARQLPPAALMLHDLRITIPPPRPMR